MQSRQLEIPRSKQGLLVLFKLFDKFQAMKFKNIESLIGTSLDKSEIYYFTLCRQKQQGLQLDVHIL